MKASRRWRRCCSSPASGNSRSGNERDRDPGERAAALARQEVERAAVHPRDPVDDREAESGARHAALRSFAAADARVNGCFSRSTSAGAIPGPRSATSSTKRPSIAAVETSTGGAPYASALSIRLATSREYAVGRNGTGGDVAGREADVAARSCVAVDARGDDRRRSRAARAPRRGPCARTRGTAR